MIWFWIPCLQDFRSIIQRQTARFMSNNSKTVLQKANDLFTKWKCVPHKVDAMDAYSSYRIDPCFEGLFSQCLNKKIHVLKRQWIGTSGWWGDTSIIYFKKYLSFASELVKSSGWKRTNCLISNAFKTRF